MLRQRLMMAAMLGVAMQSFPLTGHKDNFSSYGGPKPPDPDDKGRRAEKNAAALAKAEEKRKRRALKRAGSNGV